MKVSLRCHGSLWTEALPFVLLGLRSTVKEDLKASVAEFVYGQPLALPGELVAPAPLAPSSELPSFIERVKSHCAQLTPSPPAAHTPPRVFVPRLLETCGYVFLRDDTIKAPLQPPYTGPFKVIRRTGNTMDISIKGSPTTVSLCRVKPAVVELSLPDPPQLLADSSTSSLPPVGPTPPVVDRSSLPDSPISPTPFLGFPSPDSAHPNPSPTGSTVVVPSSPEDSPRSCSTDSVSPCRGFTPPPPAPATSPPVHTIELTTHVHPQDVPLLSVIACDDCACVVRSCDSHEVGCASQRVVQRFNVGDSAARGLIRAFVRPSGQVILWIPADAVPRSRAGRRLRRPRALDDFQLSVPGLTPRSPHCHPLPEDAEEISVTYLDSRHPPPSSRDVLHTAGGRAMWRQ